MTPYVLSTAGSLMGFLLSSEDPNPPLQGLTHVTQSAPAELEFSQSTRVAASLGLFSSEASCPLQRKTEALLTLSRFVDSAAR